MTVLYVSDDNYAHLLGVSLTSVCENNIDEHDLNVLVIDVGILDDNKKKIEDTAKKYGRTVQFFKTEINFSKAQIGKWSTNILYRIFFKTIIGDVLTEDKVLYLDCDTVVVDSLKELWQTDIDVYVCAAVYECMGKRHKANILLDSTCPYFNSGMLLINVKKWEELDVETEFRKILELNSDTIMEYPDEGLINYVLKGKIKAISPRYNLTSIKSVLTYKQLKMYRKSEHMYSENEYMEAKERPYIIHYTNNFLVTRPWFKGNGHDHPYAKYFLSYKRKSKWNEVALPEEKVSFLKNVARKLFAINGMICVTIAGFIYEYIKPIRYDKLECARVRGIKC